MEPFLYHACGKHLNEDVSLQGKQGSTKASSGEREAAERGAKPLNKMFLFLVMRNVLVRLLLKKRCEELHFFNVTCCPKGSTSQGEVW